MDTFGEPLPPINYEQVNDVQDERRNFIIHRDGVPQNCSFLNLQRATYDEYHAFFEELLPQPLNQARRRIVLTRYRGYSHDPKSTEALSCD
jgi:hypothetical protein